MTWSHSRGSIFRTVLSRVDAGVVDQDVHVPVPVEDLAEDAEDVLVVAHVSLVDAHAAVGVLVGELPGVIVIGRVAGRHRDAAVEQPLADGQPDAAGPAGDHRDLPVHFTHGVPPMLSVFRTCPWHPRWPGAARCPQEAAFRVRLPRGRGHVARSSRHEPRCLVAEARQTPGSGPWCGRPGRPSRRRQVAHQLRRGQVALPHGAERQVLAPRRVREPLVALRHADWRLHVHTQPCRQPVAARSRPLGEKVPVCRARTQLADSKLIRHQSGLGPAIRPCSPARGIHGHRIGQSRYARSILTNGANRAVEKERTPTDQAGTCAGTTKSQVTLRDEWPL